MLNLAKWPRLYSVAYTFNENIIGAPKLIVFFITPCKVIALVSFLYCFLYGYLNANYVNRLFKLERSTTIAKDKH